MFSWCLCWEIYCMKPHCGSWYVFHICTGSFKKNPGQPGAHWCPQAASRRTRQIALWINISFQIYMGVLNSDEESWRLGNSACGNWLLEECNKVVPQLSSAKEHDKSFAISMSWRRRRIQTLDSWFAPRQLHTIVAATTILFATQTDETSITTMSQVFSRSINICTQVYECEL